MAMASLAVPLNATHPPSASAGLIATPAAVTLRSPRGKLYLYTSPGCIFPSRPMAWSTAFQSAAAAPAWGAGLGFCAPAGAQAMAMPRAARTAAGVGAILLVGPTMTPPLESCSYPAYRSSTVAAKSVVPTKPTAPATTKGSDGATDQNAPPNVAAGVMARLRTR